MNRHGASSPVFEMRQRLIATNDCKESMMRTNEFFGKEVLDINANRIGKVNDIDVDMFRGVVNYMIVKAGLTKKYTINLDKIEKIGDKVFLKVARADLK